MRGKPQRGRAGSAPELKDRILPPQIGEGAIQRLLIGGNVGDRIRGVFSGDAVPEPGIIGSAEHGVSFSAMLYHMHKNSILRKYAVYIYIFA